MSRILQISSLGVMLTGPLSGIVIMGEGSTNIYDRFSSGYPGSPVENADFFMDPDVFHGVGWNDANANQSFALITPQHVVGANHFKPGLGATLNFLGLDNSVISRTVTGIATVQNGGSNTDVFVAELSSTITASEAPHYLFPSDLVAGSLVGRELVAYGRPAQVGLNTVASRDAIGALAAFGNQAELANTPTFEFTYNSVLAADGQARAEPGDSGSPSFVVENGTHVIVGTHSALAQTGNTYTTGDADLTRMIPGINDAIDSLGSTGFQVEQIPEPTTPGLLLLGLCSLGLARRRKAA